MTINHGVCVDPVGLCEAIVCDIWAGQYNSSMNLCDKPVPVSSVAKYFTIDGMFKIRNVTLLRTFTFWKHNHDFLLVRFRVK